MYILPWKPYSLHRTTPFIYRHITTVLIILSENCFKNDMKTRFSDERCFVWGHGNKPPICYISVRTTIGPPSGAKKLQVISKPCIFYHENHILFIERLLSYIAISWSSCPRIASKMTWKLDILTNNVSSGAKKLQIISKPCIFYYENHILFIERLLSYIAISLQYWSSSPRIASKMTWKLDFLMNDVSSGAMETNLLSVTFRFEPPSDHHQELKSSKSSQNHVYFTMKTIFSS
jgi:hypothetical protein